MEVLIALSYKVAHMAFKEVVFCIQRTSVVGYILTHETIDIDDHFAYLAHPPVRINNDNNNNAQYL